MKLFNEIISNINQFLGSLQLLGIINKMSEVEIQGEQNSREFQLYMEACPSQFLKTAENLKKMGMLSSNVELTFRTSDETQTFTRILNREEEEQKVANQLKVTFFHNVRGKIKKVKLLKNQSFLNMKKIRFNSSYHVTLFLKYYSDRLKRILNEHKYNIVSGRDGFLNVYINDQNISSMFVNQIRDMKRSLKFLEVRDFLLCDKLIYSYRLGNQLKKLGIYHQVWYKGMQSTIIFYSQKQSLSQMKKSIQSIGKYHLLLFKMVDTRYSFLINYLLFSLIKKSFYLGIQDLQAVETQQIQFHENKLSVVIHDMHEVFSAQITEQFFNRMKRLIPINLKAKNARKFYTQLKQNYSNVNYINFSYSQKNLCICINTQKLASINDIRKVFSYLGQNLDQQSQITFNWFHLQERNIQKYRQNLIQRFSGVLSLSNFHVQNFERFIQNRDLKCIVRLKNINKQKVSLSDQVSEIMTKLVKAWDEKQIKILEKSLQTNENYGYINIEINKGIPKESKENSSVTDSDDNASEYLDDKINNQVYDSQSISNHEQNNQQITLQGKILAQIFDQTFNLRTQSKYKLDKFKFNDNQTWKQSKCLKDLQQHLLQNAKIVARLRCVVVHTPQRQKMINVEISKQNIFFCEFSVFPKDSSYQLQIDKLKIKSIFDLQMGIKYMGFLGINSQLIYPMFSIQILKKSQP